ncbi:MAG: cytochrome c maturation protein CcmE [Alphaproteobacteria bacterium]
MKKKYQRLWLLLAVFVLAGFSAFLVTKGLEKDIMYFMTASDVVKTPPLRSFRLGGLVQQYSLQSKDLGGYYFVVTDGKASIAVDYVGNLPDLFREGQGVVVDGELQADGSMKALRVLAKHDENYVPPQLGEEYRRVILSKAQGPAPWKREANNGEATR